MNVQRHFLLLVTLTAAAMPGGQQMARAAGPADTATQATESVPDFSGVWRRGSLPWFEPPASGPGPVTNRSRRNGVSNYDQLVGDYSNPILKPEAAQTVKKFGEMSLAGVTYPNPANQCWPEPVPFIYKSFGLQILQQGDHITMLYDADRQVRRVRMNQPHPEKMTPSWYGDSVGHYEGDTLVIDTVGTRTERPYAMLDLYGTPYTKALHVVERLSAGRLRSRQRRAGTRRKRKSNRRGTSRPELSRQAPPAPIHGRGWGRVHLALVRDRNLPARPRGRMAGKCLRRKHA